LDVLQNLHRFLSLQSDVGTVGPLYLLGNIQTGKSKKKFELSLVATQTGIEVSARAPTYLRITSELPLSGSVYNRFSQVSSPSRGFEV